MDHLNLIEWITLIDDLAIHLSAIHTVCKHGKR